jgi:S-adenosylmethionine:tRNA ribosyltransferase-isomerase
MTSRRGGLVSHYDYELPPHRIARYPAARRDESRLLLVPEGTAPLRHLSFSQVVEVFHPGDVLVVNESKVLPARLLGRKPTGAPSEVLLIRPAGDGEDPLVWEALVRPGSKLKPGRTVLVSDELRVEIVDSAPGSGRIVRLLTDLSVETALERFGHMPLPPYLGRPDEALDRERYQTVYARAPGSVAAPTAGLHFTEALLGRLEERGVSTVAVTLHVGIGTFRPVEVDDPERHEMHHEWCEVTTAAAQAINDARERGGRVWAVGTTAVRTLESAVDASGRVGAGQRTTDLFIRPPYRFQAVDCLITNFHLPRSTLLMLVAAFGGYERIMSAYAAAIAGDYRFYSYGDAMAVMGPRAPSEPGAHG